MYDIFQSNGRSSWPSVLPGERNGTWTHGPTLKRRMLYQLSYTLTNYDMNDIGGTYGTRTCDPRVMSSMPYQLGQCSNGPDDRIRTCGILLPKQALCQTELHPDIKWCCLSDLNRHVVRHKNLNLARMPISPKQHISIDDVLTWHLYRDHCL